MKMSVVTVCYNACATLEETIRSVAAQTYPNIEYVVIDGGSTDGTQDILSTCDDIIDKWVSEPDEGLYQAMNKGLKAASGDFIGFLNADDRFASSDALEAVAYTAKATEADCILADTAILSAQKPDRVKRFYSARSFRPWQFRFGHMPPHPSTYVRRDLLMKLGGFDAEFPISADFDLMLRLYKELNPKVAYLPKTLVAMRGGGVTTRGMSSNVSINQQVLASCRKQGVWSHPVAIWSKYFFKIFQYLKRPSDLSDKLV